MCGIAGICGPGWTAEQLSSMVAVQRHRGPDAQGRWVSPDGAAGLGHNRLSILDLSAAGQQPMWNADGTLAIVFNGEVYNYLELRAELGSYPYRTHTDTEVILAAWERWGESALDRFIGMFAFLIWDTQTRMLTAVRDRFGVKPLHYSLQADGTLLLASEIKALHAAGIPATPDERVWATYLRYGTTDLGDRTFWRGVQSVQPGHLVQWRDGCLTVRKWYDLADRCGVDYDDRPEEVVRAEYLRLLEESVRFRFRADVPVGINLSGGLDSSTLLGLVHRVQGNDSRVHAYTFVTGEPEYDELPWVRQMLDRTQHPLRVCQLTAPEVPELAASVQRHQDEPFGGLPTLAYARLFEQARADGTIVLLDGQGMDEQWAGYDYYAGAANGRPAGIVQGSSDRPVRPECLEPEFAELAESAGLPQPFPDPLRNAQYRDTRFTKIPRALRFNDRASMRSSTELREPFLDHRLFEIAMRQRSDRKIYGNTRKRMIREIASDLLPAGVVEAPKRPVQTPQREWLRGPLRPWAEELISEATRSAGCWLRPGAVQQAWRGFLAHETDNSFFVWQWLSIALLKSTHREAVAAHV
jgi:asparagine synthase (glutamine-hydrolysing)